MPIVLATFDVNDLVRMGNHTGTNQDDTLRAPFRDISGTAADPTTVVLVLAKPDRSTLHYSWPDAGDDGTLVKESTGRFYIDVLLDSAGSWFWQLTGTGTVQTREEGEFWVRQSLVG